MTSPWLRGLDLLADDDLHAVVGRLRRRLERAGDLVVVGHGDRARAPGRAPWPAAPRPASRSRGCGRCACAGRRRWCAGPLSARAASALPRTSWRRAASVRVEGLELVGHGAPRRAGAPRARRRSRRSPSATSRAELRGERLDVAGLEQQPGLAVGQQLLVDRQARGDRHGAGGLAREHQPRRGRGAVGGGDEHVGAGQRLLARRVDEAHALAQVGAQRRRGRRPALGVHDRVPRRAPGRAGAARAGTARSAPRSSSSTKAMRTRPSSAARGGAASRRRRA